MPLQSGKSSEWFLKFTFPDRRWFFFLLQALVVCQHGKLPENSFITWPRTSRLESERQWGPDFREGFYMIIGVTNLYISLVKILPQRCLEVVESFMIHRHRTFWAQPFVSRSNRSLNDHRQAAVVFTRLSACLSVYLRGHSFSPVCLHDR